MEPEAWQAERWERLRDGVHRLAKAHGASIVHSEPWEGFILDRRLPPGHALIFELTIRPPTLWDFGSPERHELIPHVVEVTTPFKPWSALTFWAYVLVGHHWTRVVNPWIESINADQRRERHGG